MDNNNNNKQPERTIWGRRQNRPIKGVRADAMRDILPQIEIAQDLLTKDTSLTAKKLFNNDKETWLEIGFGGGEHVIGLLKKNPTINMIGAEPFKNGMANFTKNLNQADISRTKVIMDDAMTVVKSLADNSISRLYILNPDPWHKKRHHKRRIINNENLTEFARILKPTAQLIMTSDVPYLTEWMHTHTYKHQSFTWDATSCKDWLEMPKDWITTRYQIKGAKGAKKMSYLFFTCDK